MDLIFFCSIIRQPVKWSFFFFSSKNYEINLTFFPSDRLNFHLSCFFKLFLLYHRLTHPHPNHNLNSSHDLFPIKKNRNLGNKILRGCQLSVSITTRRNQLEGFIVSSRISLYIFLFLIHTRLI